MKRINNNLEQRTCGSNDTGQCFMLTCQIFPFFFSLLLSWKSMWREECSCQSELLSRHESKMRLYEPSFLMNESIMCIILSINEIS